MKTNTENKITIIIPSKTYDYNLRYCINKIRLFYKKISIILILDEENSSIRDSHIKVIVSGRKSIGYKRNKGVNLSKTPFVAFIDSDAYPNSRWLDDILSTFKKNKSVAVVGGPNLSPETNNEEEKLVANTRKLSFVTINSFIKFKSNKTFNVTFLPTVNMVIKSHIYKKLGGMDVSLNAFEDLSLMQKLIKNKHKILFNGKAYIYHRDRNLKHFFRQRLVYGSEIFNILIRYPCKQTFSTFFALTPFLFVLTLPLIFFSNFLLKIYFICISVLLIFCIINSFRINFSGNYFKSLKSILIAVFGPGMGFVASFFFNSKSIRKIYTQR